MLLMIARGLAQEQVDIRVYDFDEGLSHRNVFRIAQDTSGFIWVATINGLNRFDGYDFLRFNSRSEHMALPSDAISDLLIDEHNRLWLSHPDYLSVVDPAAGQVKSLKIKEGAIIQRESKVPHNLLLDKRGRLWMATFDERSALTTLQTLEQDSLIVAHLQVEGQYTRRPMAQLGDDLYIGAFENELWRLGPDDQVAERYLFPLAGRDRSRSRIVQLQAHLSTLWVLLNDGRLYYRPEGRADFSPHRINELLPYRLQAAGSLLVEANGNIWIGGNGALWYYDALADRLVNFDEQVRQLVKNAFTYRQILRDRSGVIWVASDFGIIRIVLSDDLFSHYLSGGSEYCSNVYCSTRGITEDEDGNIYFSYYNSIHVLDARNHSLRLLFPANDYFNYPFGLEYFQDALWTGNGRRIDLRTLKVDTIFQKPSVDLGAVAVGYDGILWFGYLQWLYQYDPEKKLLTEFTDNQGRWDSLDGQISHLYQGRTGNYLWVSTLDKGLYKIDPRQGRIAHYHQGAGSPAPLLHNQVNATYEDRYGFLWIATADGLHRLEIATDSLRVFHTRDGLPNAFINGLLSEGDSVIWVSTDNGLCRFSLARQWCTNFFTTDGLTANEFNRISFYKASNGRMYFGGLNGINAFYPSRRFLERKEEQNDAPLLFTGFTKLDGASDQLVSQNLGLSPANPIILNHRDKMFQVSFALADYRQPAENQYSYLLEGLDRDWSAPSSVNTVRYNNIPAGKYRLRIRAKTGNADWNHQELIIPVIVRPAYYKTWWFWTLSGGLTLAGFLGLARYRIYTIEKREQELETLVRIRTRELEAEKHKSEELLLNILPAETAEELKTHGFAKAKRHEMVTVMFSDFKGFSRISERLEPEELVAEIDHCFRAFDHIVEKYGLEKIKTVGDAYLCVGGISSTEDQKDASNVVEAALEIQYFLNARAAERRDQHLHFFEARIGIHTGPIVAGIVGIKKFAYDIWGDTVNIASRMETYGEAGRVNISEDTYRLIRERFRCLPHGEFTENANALRMYFVVEPLDERVTAP